MKRIFCVFLCLFLLSSCGGKNSSKTEFMLDTVCTITVEKKNEDALKAAFDTAKELENRLSRTNINSEISKINNSNGALTVSEDTAKLIQRAIYYGDITSGKFDITLCSVSQMWDFTGDTLPDFQKIADAVKNVDYKKIEVKGNTVNSGGTRLDLGAIAKGYICDMVAQNLRENSVDEAIINFGGNVTVIGDNHGKGYTVGIAKPFSDTTIASVVLKNKSAVTSGIYQRYIEKDGKIYHHILSSETGMPVDTDIVSATVIFDNSTDADALSTACMLLGLNEATKLIESIDSAEAFFIDKNGNLTYTDGIYSDSNVFKIRGE